MFDTGCRTGLINALFLKAASIAAINCRVVGQFGGIFYFSRNEFRTSSVFTDSLEAAEDKHF